MVVMALTAMIVHSFNTSVATLNVADLFHRRGNAEHAANSHAHSVMK
jgi:hypothetical protein